MTEHNYKMVSAFVYTQRKSIRTPQSHRGNVSSASIEIATLSKDIATTIMPMQERLVSFQDDQEVIEVPCRSDYTADELSFMYFSAGELEAIWMRENRLTVELSVCGRISSDDDDPTGLDTIQTRSLRSKHTAVGIQTVLTEQELERIEGGVREDYYIAKIYRNATRQNKVLARHRGFDNAIHVKTGDFEEQILSPSSRSTIITDNSPRRRDHDICKIGTITEPPSPETSRRSAARFARMIVVPIDCKTDNNPRRRDHDICKIGTRTDPHAEASRRSAARLSRMIVVPVGCK
mmetsp:Transcript_26118/g.63695  ORF Transcript_26118/g.63695 Transcript_26118/m.63695 type:complete len:292 (+) Transcript_26118:1565-2440(+)